MRESTNRDRAAARVARTLPPRSECDPRRSASPRDPDVLRAQTTPVACGVLHCAHPEARRSKRRRCLPIWTAYPPSVFRTRPKNGGEPGRPSQPDLSPHDRRILRPLGHIGDVRDAIDKALDRRVSETGLQDAVCHESESGHGHLLRQERAESDVLNCEVAGVDELSQERA